MQRRHQKLIEESPSPASAAGNAAARCAKRPCGWSKRPATPTPAPVEFIVDQSGQFLLHRSQRPHPGRASGDRNGHRHRPDQVADPHRRRRAAAVQARRHQSQRARPSNAASTPKTRARNFQPSPGKIERLIVPGGFGVRFDSHAYSRLHRLAVLRFDDRQADRPPADAPRGHRLHVAGACANCASRASAPSRRCSEKSSSTRRSAKAASTRRSSSGPG